MRKVEVSSYNPEWVTMFEEEAKALRHVFSNCLVDIYHIGSTSVPGLEAKPIIDIMPVVQDIAAVDECNADMEALGYEARGENGIFSRRYFQKGGDNRTHHVHVYQAGSLEIERHLAFRDYLRTHVDAAKAYGDSKRRLAEQFPYDIESYIAGKDGFVNDIERRALKWYQDQHRQIGRKRI